MPHRRRRPDRRRCLRRRSPPTPFLAGSGRGLPRRLRPGRAPLSRAVASLGRAAAYPGRIRPPPVLPRPDPAALRLAGTSSAGGWICGSPACRARWIRVQDDDTLAGEVDSKRDCEMKQEKTAAATTMTTTPIQPRAHVLLVSTAFQSHVNPLMRLGRRLAAKGVLVTFTTALRKGIRLDEALHGIDDDDDALSRLFRVERLRGDALWEPDDPRFGVPGDMARHVEAAGPAALKALVRREAEAGRPVTCVVANAFAPWALRVAGELRLPRAMLWIQSCALLSVYYHYVHSLAAFPDDASGPLVIPGLPELGTDELRPLLVYSTDVNDIWRRMLVADLGSVRDKAVSWVFVNTFDELEHEAIAALGEHAPVIPVGPLIEPEDGNKGDDDGIGIAAWLDAQAPRSVVFVAFGSIANTGDEETAEIAEALASTGRPFLWVLRDESRALLSRGTLGSIEGDPSSLGRVVPWCRQARVLAHGAVGCFVTHCGWNSTAEALAAGVPVVACPRWSDQRVNAKFVVDVYGVGVRGPTPVTSDALRVSVEEVMSGPEGEAMGARAAGWKERSRAAVAHGGSSDLGLQAFVDQIC